MIEIDGASGEGGGQIIRSSLALSLITGKSFAVRNIRAARDKPGLRNQHLTCVNAAAEIGHAKVTGAEVGAKQFTFRPSTVKPGTYRFNIGTAGSTMLVLQTILPPLMVAKAASDLIIEGGTHNVKAPPFDFIAETFVPLINKMGPQVEVTLERYGFYPPGGGRIAVSIQPAKHLSPLQLTERGETEVAAKALVIKLPRSIAEREANVLQRELPELLTKTEIAESTNAMSPGNVVALFLRSKQLTETISQIGQRGVTAERVAEAVAAEAKKYLSVDVAVGEHLADQLLIPLALAGAGSFLTLTPSLHTTTNIAVVEQFLNVEIRCEQVKNGVYRISAHSRPV